MCTPKQLLNKSLIYIFDIAEIEDKRNTDKKLL